MKFTQVCIEQGELLLKNTAHTHVCVFVVSMCVSAVLQGACGSQISAWLSSLLLMDALCWPSPSTLMLSLKTT